MFLKHIDESVYDTYKRNWRFYTKYFKDRNYMPMRCEKFCPYCKCCHHGNNMLDTAKIKRKYIICLKEPEYCDIADVQAELKYYFYKAVNSDDSKIHIGYYMGYSGNTDKLRYRETEHNGYKFWFYTYDNELLRRIQLWMIESELEQSVGRARLLREECTVHLFSDFPLRQAELVRM